MKKNLYKTCFLITLQEINKLSFYKNIYIFIHPLYYFFDNKHKCIIIVDVKPMIY
jgi:hypothetical protein